MDAVPEIRVLARRLNRSRRLLEQLIADRERLERRLRSLRVRLADEQAAHREDTRRAEEAREKLQRLRRELRSATAERARLQARVDRAAANLDKLRPALKAAIRQRDRARQSSAAGKSEIVRLTANVAALQETAREQDELLARIDASRADLVAEVLALAQSLRSRSPWRRRRRSVAGVERVLDRLIALDAGRRAVRADPADPARPAAAAGRPSRIERPLAAASVHVVDVAGITADALLAHEGAEYVVLVDGTVELAASAPAALAACLHGCHAPSVAVPVVHDDLTGERLPDWMSLEAAALLLEAMPSAGRTRVSFAPLTCCAVSTATLRELLPDGDRLDLRGSLLVADVLLRAAATGVELVVATDALAVSATAARPGEDAPRRELRPLRRRHGRRSVRRALDTRAASVGPATWLLASLEAVQDRPARLGELLAETLPVRYLLPELTSDTFRAAERAGLAVRGMQELGLDARLLVQRDDASAVRALTGVEPAPYARPGDLRGAVGTTAAVVAAHPAALPAARRTAFAGESLLPAVYVQSAAALRSVDASGCLVVAPHAEMAGAVDAGPVAQVAAVELGVDEDVFQPRGDEPDTAGTLQVTAVLHPPTAGPVLRLLEELRERLDGEVSIVTIGAEAASLEAEGVEPGEWADRHLGNVEAEALAAVLARSDLLFATDRDVDPALVLAATVCGAAPVIHGGGPAAELVADGQTGVLFEGEARSRGLQELLALTTDWRRLRGLQTQAVRWGHGRSKLRMALSEYLAYERAHRARFSARPAKPAATADVVS